MVDYAKEMNREYKKLISCFFLSYDGGNIDNSVLDDYYTKCALYLWNKDNISIKTQYLTITEINSQPNSSPKVDFNNIPKELPIPNFCDELIKYSGNSTPTTYDIFVDITEKILLLFTQIDFKTTDSEKEEISTYCNKLRAKASNQMQTNVANENTSEEKPLKTIDDLNKLIGLKRVKDEVNKTFDFIKYQNSLKAVGIETENIPRHFVFTGNPGTGKTTVARILADIYKGMGILSKGGLVETDREGLVAGYVGQTAIKTKEVLDSALGGVLFIDEAYTLSKGGENDFGKEAIDTILKYMEDNRNDLIVIVAGYDQNMNTFINSNPGLKSRFTKFIHFDDYSVDELYDIFKLECENRHMHFNEDLSNDIREKIESIKANAASSFGNGRTIRKLADNIQENLACRVKDSKNIEELTTIKIEDLDVKEEELI